ncbi:importin subunit alpha-1-like [Bolinopsis microptera]
MLTVQDPRTVTVALDGIHNILTAANKISEEVCSKVAIMLEECGGLDLIEKLQEHENESIYAKSALIIESFYKGEDGENEELQPQVTNGQYLFNAPTNNTGKISF